MRAWFECFALVAVCAYPAVLLAREVRQWWRSRSCQGACWNVLTSCRCRLRRSSLVTENCSMENAKTPMTPAQRQAAYRARKGKQVNLLLPDDVKDGLDAYLARQHMDGQPDMTMSDVIVKLLRSQLLRRR